MNTIQTIYKQVMRAVFPQNIYCICCDSVIDASRRYSLCDNCISKFGWVTERTCAKCGKPLSEKNYDRGLCYSCRETEHIFDKGYTCSQYGLYERALIMDLKYRDKSYIARSIGEIMADRMDAEFGISDRNRYEETEADDGNGFPWDAVTWVPVHKTRLEERGYDQAELLTKYFAEDLCALTWKTPGVRSLLERAKATPPMKDLGPFERRINVEGAFRVRAEDKDAKEAIDGKSILLIDDIYTTGATLDACAYALKEAGAERVDVLTFASGGDWAKADESPITKKPML